VEVGDERVAVDGGHAAMKAATEEARPYHLREAAPLEAAIGAASRQAAGEVGDHGTVRRAHQA